MSPALALRTHFIAVCALAAAAPVVAQEVRADRCSVAAGRDIIDVEIMQDCSTRITIILGVQEIIQEREVDRELLELIGRGAYDEAIERIEELTRRPSNNSSTYLSIAATILSTQGMPDETLQYARRAYEADRNNGFVAARYYAALALSGRHVDARSFINEIHRRRAQIPGIGGVWIEYAWMETNYSTPVLSVWFQAAGSCGRRFDDREPAAPTQTSFAEKPGCAFDDEAITNVRALRERAYRLAREAAATESDSRVSLQLQYYGMHYVLLSDLLLGDNAAAARSEEAMDAIIARLDRQFGPWALLTSFAGAFHLDALTPARFLERKYVLFDRAMGAAPAAPITSLASFAADDRLLQRYSGLMLASYRLAWARAAVRLQKGEEAWTGLARAIAEARSYGNSALAISVRIGSLSLMTTIPNAGFTPDIRIMREEYLRLRRSFSQDPRLWTSLSTQFLQVGDALCDMNILTADECDPDVPTLELEDN